MLSSLVAAGVWMAPLPGDDRESILAIANQNGDMLLLTYLDDWNDDMDAWFPFLGPFNGTTGTLSLLLTSSSNGDIPLSATGTFTLTSNNTATFQVKECQNYFGQDNCVPIGTVFNFSKIF